MLFDFNEIKIYTIHILNIPRVKISEDSVSISILGTSCLQHVKRHAISKEKRITHYFKREQIQLRRSVSSIAPQLSQSWRIADKTVPAVSHSFPQDFLPTKRFKCNSLRHLCAIPEGCLVSSKKVIASFRETIPTSK